MNPIQANLSAFRHILKPKGRAMRSEYWWVIATLLSGVILATVIDSNVFAEEADRETGLYSAATVLFIAFYVPWLIASVIVTIRRLHDVDMSGWFVFLYILPLGIGFVFMAIICSRRGTPGPNRFGRDPLYRDEIADADIFG